jgi:hypothetical protein
MPVKMIRVSRLFVKMGPALMEAVYATLGMRGMTAALKVL